MVTDRLLGQRAVPVLYRPPVQAGERRQLPVHCTSFVEDSADLRGELTRAVKEMLEYHQSHPSGEPIHRNCKDELTEIRDLEGALAEKFRQKMARFEG
jgi:hypothetical protein